MSELKLSTEEISQLWFEAQDQALAGFPAPFHFAKAVIELQARRTQPEATKPAQDLGAAILALPLPEIGGNFQQGFRTALRKAATIASSANALSAGDRVDAERYRWLREKRDILWKNHIPWCVHLIREHSIPTSVAIHGVALDAAIDAAIQAQKDGRLTAAPPAPTDN